MYKEGSFFKDAYYQEYLILKNAGFEVYFGADTELDFNENGNCFYKNKLITTIKRCMEVWKFSDTLLKQFTKNKRIILERKPK